MMTDRGPEFNIPMHHEVAREYRVFFYVSTYVGTYICSPFVIALVPTFINGFNITLYRCCV